MQYSAKGIPLLENDSKPHQIAQPEYDPVEPAVGSRKAKPESPKLPLTYQSINGLDALAEAGEDVENAEGQLLCTERELPLNIEEEIKDGFFELKQKFRAEGPSSIYISHITLH